MKIGDKIMVRAGVYSGKTGEVVAISVDDSNGSKHYGVVVPPDTRTWWFTDREALEIVHISRKQLRKELKKFSKELLYADKVAASYLNTIIEKI